MANPSLWIEPPYLPLFDMYFREIDGKLLFKLEYSGPDLTETAAVDLINALKSLRKVLVCGVSRIIRMIVLMLNYPISNFYLVQTISQKRLSDMLFSFISTPLCL